MPGCGEEAPAEPVAAVTPPGLQATGAPTAGHHSCRASLLPARAGGAPATCPGGKGGRGREQRGKGEEGLEQGLEEEEEVDTGIQGELEM